MIPGGDTVQLLRTKEYLEKLGLQVDVSLELKPNLEKCDIVHLFHLLTDAHETYIRFLNARRWGKPVVLSPIYWNMNEFTRIGLKGLRRKVYYFFPDGILRRILSRIYNLNFMMPKEFQSLKLHLDLDMSKNQNELLNKCDAILPNSKAEIKILSRDFRINNQRRFLVVPNAVDESFKVAKPDFFVSKYGLEDFVLCVGRIEDRKNQLSLIKALKGTGMKLVLVGGPNKRSCMLRYYELCKREADENVLFIDWMEQPELASAYAAAKVHVLPSWYETPGLTSLEAGLAGCNVVTTDRGSTKEYFSDYAWYCDPSDLRSIRSAVLESFAARKTSKLRRLILENYTWDKAAERTLEAYSCILDRGMQNLS